MKKSIIKWAIEKSSDVVVSPIKWFLMWIASIKRIAYLLIVLGIIAILLPPQHWNLFENLLGFLGFLLIGVALIVLLLFKKTKISEYADKAGDAIDTITDKSVDIVDSLTNKALDTASKGVDSLGKSLKEALK